MPQEITTILEQRRIILGVAGSVSAYKAVDLASQLTQAGASVDVIMTRGAQHFVGPLTFEAVTGRPVFTDLWNSTSGELPTHIAHIGLGEHAELIAVVPASANVLARMAVGMADDLLTVTALAARCPLLVAPAMDGGMYEHPATQANLATLKSRGAIIVEPDTGRFASGFTGKGRLPNTARLMGEIRRGLGRNGMLAGYRILVTAGGTHEPLDPIRYLTNRSTGKQGYALAQAALDAGAEVTLITTPTALPRPIGAQVVDVLTASDLRDAVLDHIEGVDVLIMAAAVADFRPVTVSEQKIKKSAKNESVDIAMVQNPDVLMEIKRYSQESGWPRVTVGFAAESHDLIDYARAKLEDKHLDLIVANDITDTVSGFGADNNRVLILDRKGGQQWLDLAS
ncbi:MAG: bifunctional phosphopantothenoylcysteine decarboxylase/phosphopantothenate--cysteine ligase CoaBC, partial [Anaerolineae bacterium]|nr:bifunctional phosphopantothenoylcysteine decarboxylase/phosphopantothenate--cysteine ligase CoaBC [Anaerolineae bacterium]